MLSVVALVIAGGLGAVSRAVLDAFGRSRLAGADGGSSAGSPTIAWPTTAINVSGSFVAGLVAGTVGGDAAAGSLAGVLAVGYLGAFTTFSTAMLQTVDLLVAGARVRGVVHAVFPLIAGIGAAGVGWALAG